MENYNLTAEIKKISGAINNSSPNTELGNINGSVGNLDTAMQGVATAINNKAIPDNKSNIDGVAAAINNKTIPDNTSNITAVANAIVSMAGGKDLDDLITILTTMNGNIANLGSNHVTSITAVNDGFRVTYGNGTTIVVPNLAIHTRYTDTNNIGATDVQGAVDKLVDLSTWKYLGEFTAQAHASYPTSWKEMVIFCTGPNTTWTNYQFNLLHDFVTNTNRPTNSAIRSGYYVSSSDYGECTLVVTPSDVFIGYMRTNGVEQATNSTMHVYYR